MINKVEYEQIKRHDEVGWVFTFTYDHDLCDTYELFGDDANTAMAYLSISPDPETLLINLRNLMRITVH